MPHGPDHQDIDGGGASILILLSIHAEQASGANLPVSGYDISLFLTARGHKRKHDPHGTDWIESPSVTICWPNRGGPMDLLVADQRTYLSLPAALSMNGYMVTGATNIVCIFCLLSINHG